MNNPTVRIDIDAIGKASEMTQVEQLEEKE